MTFLELYFVQFGANFLWLVLLSVQQFGDVFGAVFVQFGADF